MSETTTTAKKRRRIEVCTEDSRARARGPALPSHRAKLDAAGAEAICEAIVGGETIMAIAERHGVSHASLLDWIACDEARAARMVQARTLSSWWCDDRALHTIRTAKDQFELQKAREEAVHLRWRASKIAPKVYGDRVEVSAKQALVIEVDLTGARPPSAPLTLDAQALLESTAESEARANAGLPEALPFVSATVPPPEE